MEKLKIVKKDNYLYELEDESGKIFRFTLDFFDSENIPNVGNYVCIRKELLDPKYEGYSTSYTFGNLENKYGKNNISIEDIDVIKIIKDDVEIYLKRLYG